MIHEPLAPDVTRWFLSALGLLPGEAPFPWQEELLRRFLDGQLERSLDIPTGLGKTAVMAIWLVARACGADLPRRLVYVVDRRAVVDQATEVAERLRECVEADPALKAALGLDRPLPISTLRGQHVDNKEWLEDPTSPAVIVGTVDMVGSRLLFEGYGTSRKMRPYHAGMLGADTLLVLDEAHLVPPFEKLLETIADGAEEFGPRGASLRALVPPLRLLSLSATGRTGKHPPFGLTEGDLEPGTVSRRRLDAVKRLKLVSLSEGGKLAVELADRAWELSSHGRAPVRCIVFSNSREDAAQAKRRLEELAKSTKQKVDTQLFVGARRVFERAGTAQWLQANGFIGQAKVARERPAFVFATSAGEVGVDLDADHMVCDLVAWERMVQRLGRVNRRGDGDATVVAVLEPKKKAAVDEAYAKARADWQKKEHDAVNSYGAAAAAQALLGELPHVDDAVDASPGALRALKLRSSSDPQLSALLEAATTPAPLRPALTRPLLDAWSMTSLEEHTGRPEVQPWIRGWLPEEPPQTTVVWRTHLPVRQHDGTAAASEVEAFFEAAPPHLSEVLETETYRVVEWLKARAAAILPRGTRHPAGAQLALELSRDTVVAYALSPAGSLRRALRLRDLLVTHGDKRAEKRATQDLEHNLGNTRLIVDSRLAGLAADGLLDPSEAGAPSTADDGRPWNPGDPSASSEAESARAAPPAVSFRVRVATLDDTAADPHWRARFHFAIELSPEGDPTRWLVVEKWRHDTATGDDGSATSRPQLLTDHQELVAQKARRLAARLDLSSRYADMLAQAALHHDSGKGAARWQRAFNAASDGVYAKTPGPIRRAVLDGYRHELGSLLEATTEPPVLGLPPDLADLALHLISSHHGYSRPTIPTSGCETAPPSALEQQARDTALRFARLQRRWGPWGLAWWEALLRSSDQQASRENDAGGQARLEEV